MKSFAEQVKEARKNTLYGNQPLTQERLAMQAGICRSAVQSMESGRQEPSVDTLCKLVAVLPYKFTFQVGNKVITVSSSRAKE